ncbi:hypothetical protein ScPMuIL_018867 [Solemya velum]
MAIVKALDPNTFHLSKPFWIVTLSSGLCCLLMATYAPMSVPQFLGPLGRFVTEFGLKFPNVCSYLVMFVVIAHGLEALYTIKVCSDLKLNMVTTCKWTLQTMLWGFASLMQLVKLRSHEKKD